MLVLMVAVASLLAGIRLLFSVPKPLLFVAGVVFGLCTLVFWFTRGRANGAARAQMFGLVMAWIAVSALFFGTAFWVDRAGWIWFRLTGYNVTLSEDYAAQVDTSASEFARRNPMFTLSSEVEGGLILGGEHTFDRTIVIPRGASLTIEPGTIIRFGRGCSMISYGPVTALGTETHPIRFSARYPFLKWGVVGVVGDGTASRSSFEHAHFEHGRQARINAIDFRGCLSLIGADVDIRHCRFSSLYGKDGVYVRSGDVAIRNSLFTDTFKDGLDLDGGSGVITNNRFVDCGDEGIDLSDNGDVDVFDNVILDARGGRVGADENLAAIRARNTFGFTDEYVSATGNDPGVGATN